MKTNKTKKIKIKWSTNHYEGYSMSTMLIGKRDGHRVYSNYNSHWCFPFAQMSIWWAKTLITWEIKSLSN